MFPTHEEQQQPQHATRFKAAHARGRSQAGVRSDGQRGRIFYGRGRRVGRGVARGVRAGSPRGAASAHHGTEVAQFHANWSHLGAWAWVQRHSHWTRREYSKRDVFLCFIILITWRHPELERKVVALNRDGKNRISCKRYNAANTWLHTYLHFCTPFSFEGGRKQGLHEGIVGCNRRGLCRRWLKYC